MQASQSSQPVRRLPYRQPEIQPDERTHQDCQIPQPKPRLAPSSPPLWMQVKLRKLNEARKDPSLKKAKAVKNFYLDFLVAIRQTSLPSALPGSRDQLISSRVKESIALELSQDFKDLRRSLVLKLASLKKRQTQFQSKKMNPLVRLLYYPRHRLLGKKLQAYEGTIRDIIRITQKLQSAIRDAQAVAKRQNRS